MSYIHTPLPQTISSTIKMPLHEDDDDTLNNIPSSFDLALNGSPTLHFKTSHNLPDPSRFAHRSSSTSSSRSSTSNTYSQKRTKTWRTSVHDIYISNQPLFLVALAQLFGALMNVTARLLELEGDGMHPFQILFARQGLTMVFCTAWMWWKKVDGFPFGRKGVRGLLVARACSGFWGIFGMYYSLQYLPVADATVITFLAPSVASYGCYLLFSEPFPRSAQYASLVSLIGVVLIARPFSSSSPASSSIPTASTNTTSMAEISSYPIPTSAQRLSAVFFALLGVLGAAGAYTTIRWIGTRAHPLISVNYFSTFCFLISTLFLTLSAPVTYYFYPTSNDNSSPAAGDSQPLTFSLPASALQWTQLLFLGVCGFTMQYLLTTGLGGTKGNSTNASSSSKKGVKGGGARATNMVYTNILFSLGLDRLVFGISPKTWSLVGGGLVLGSAIFVGISKGRDESGKNEGSGREREREDGTRDEEMGMLSLEALDVDIVEEERGRSRDRG